MKQPPALTESQLLAMPEAEYMNDAQLEFFKYRLLQWRQELLQNAATTGVHLKEVELSADPNDRATTEEEHMFELRMRDRERKLLSKVNAALARVDDGSYGYCEDTGEPIGLARLLARPTATLCVEAQERREYLQRLHAD